MTGKTIRIFHAAGEPTSMLLPEIRNWTGKLLVAPRSQLDQLSKREEARRTGVYLLKPLRREPGKDCRPSLLLTP